MPQLLFIVILSIVFGALVAFYGNRLSKFVLNILAIFLSFSLVFSRYDINLRSLIMGLVLSFIIILLLRTFINFGLFFIGLIFGLGLVSNFIGLLPISLSEYRNIIVIAFAVFIGLVTVISKGFIIRLVTAIIGASLMSKAILFLVANSQRLINNSASISNGGELNSYINQIFASSMTMSVWILTIVIAIMGFFYQRRRS